MKSKALILAFTFIIVLPAVSEGQVGNALKNRLNKAISNKIDTVAQKESQKTISDAETKETDVNKADKNSDTKTSSGMNFGALMGGKVTLKYDDTYLFNNRIYMQMEVYDKKNVTKTDFYIYFNDANLNAGFESKIEGKSEEGEVEVKTSFVSDGDKKVFIMLTDMGETKMGTIGEIPSDSTLKSQRDVANNTTITKTGNSKVIAGYKCDEYSYIDNDTRDHGRMWVTKDLKLHTDKASFSNAGLPASFSNSKVEGITLAIESYNKKDELLMKSETIEVNLGYEHNISTKGYSLRQINISQGKGNKK